MKYARIAKFSPDLRYFRENGGSQEKLWEQEVPGSNPGAPTYVTCCQYCVYRSPLSDILGRGLYVTLYVEARIGRVTVVAKAGLIASCAEP